MTTHPPDPPASHQEHIALDRNLRVTAASEALLAGLGLTLDDVLGHHIGELMETGAEAKAGHFELLGAVTASVAHDFNNLLTIIQGNLALVCDQLPTDSTIRHHLLQAQHAGQRATDLVAQLLDSGPAEEPGGSIDLNGVVLEATQLLRRVVGEEIELLVESEPVWPVRVRRSQIEQILLNLAVNARDAMPQGGTLSLRLSKTRIAGPCPGVRPSLPTGDYAVIAFGDSGCGMDESTQARLFEPFFTTKRKGTGLGLATIARIVGKARGGIKVDTEAGQGSKFEIYLPRA